MPQQGHSMSACTQYKVPPLCLALVLYYQHSNNGIRLNHTCALPILCTRHGGSTEPALPMATGNKTRQREREEEKPRIQPMFTVASLPRRVGAARSGSSCIQLVQVKAQESQGSGRGLWTHRMDQPTKISSQRSMF